MWGQQGWFLSKSQDSGSCAIAWSSFDQQYALALLEFWSLGTITVCVLGGGLSEAYSGKWCPRET